MEMTINEIIKEMEEEYNKFLEGTGLNDSNYMKRERFNNLDCDRVCTANEMTLTLLHKYQKIEQIVERFKNKYDHTASMDLMMEIKEVLEDGDND